MEPSDPLQPDRQEDGPKEGPGDARQAGAAEPLEPAVRRAGEAPRRMRIADSPGWARQLGWVVLLLGAVGWFFLGRDRALDQTFQIDEAEWISMGVHSYQLAVRGESVDEGATPEELEQAAAAPWREGIQSSTFGWMYPVLVKLGFGWTAERAGVVDTTRMLYLRFHDKPRNLSKAARERIKPRYLPALLPTRALIAAFAGGIALALFCIAGRAAGWPAGAAAALLWMASPTAREVAVYVRADLPPILFSLAALAFAIAARRALAGARGGLTQVGCALLLGLLVGAAAGSKLNGTLVSFAVPLWLIAARAGLRRDAHAGLGEPEAGRPGWLRSLTTLGLTAAVCAAVFWACLPGLWGTEPVSAVRDLLAEWRGSLAHQVRVRGGIAAVPEDAFERLQLVLRRITGDLDPLRQLFGWTTGPWAVGLGTLACIAAALGRWPGAKPPERWVPGPTAEAAAGRVAAARMLLAFAVVIVIGTGWGLPLDQTRLFLPALVCALMLQAVAVGVLAALLAALRGRVSARPR